MSLNLESLAIRIIAVVVSMSVHEMAHALVSYWMGDPTAKRMGRLSLNPFKHIDWMGVACLLVFGFGWAKPVPIDSSYYKDAKTGIIWTSFAGPLANFITAFISIFVYVLLAKFGFVSVVYGFVGQCLFGIATVSVGFGIFNLIPIPPLDGSKILFSFLPDDKYYRFIEGSTFIYILFIALLYLDVLSYPMMTLRTTILELFINISSGILL